MNYPDLQLETRLVGHLPVIRAIIDELGIADVIDRRCPPHVLSRVSDAECAVLMILNILSGRVALFRMNEWLGRTDAGLLLGDGVPADAFDDSRLAAALDHLDAAGTDVLLADVVARFLARPDRPHTYSVHQDTTSLSVYGDYEGADDLIPTWGYSKDHRPDLKQLVFGMVLHGAIGTPLVARLMDGNTSDVTANRDLLSDLARQLPEEDEITVVGDCKLVDAGTLGGLLSQGFHVVSLLPDTFSLRAELVETAYAAQPMPELWPELEKKPGKKKADPALFYRGTSVTRPFAVDLVKPAQGDQPERRVTSLEPMRFLVVHSDTLVQSFDAGLPDRIQKEKETCEVAIKRLDKKPFRCADDAMAAARRTTDRLRWHQAQVVATPIVHELTRPRRGRPKKGEVAPTETVWRIDCTLTQDETAIANERRHASCFVLLTDHLETTSWPDTRILAEYRHQSLIEGHTGFRWLKGPAAVCPLFLKRPDRIRALGLIFVLALMVRNWLQYTLRTSLRENKETIPHPFTKKPVDNLTAEMALEHFRALHAGFARLSENQPWQRISVRLREPAMRGTCQRL